MATLSDLEKAGPAGDFYAWVLKRYQRVILRLVLLLIIIMIGFGLAGFWFMSRLSALEEEQPVRSPTVEQPTLEQWQRSVTEQTQRDAALGRRVTETTRCLNGNLVALNKALEQLVLGRLQARDFVAEFKLRTCS